MTEQIPHVLEKLSEFLDQRLPAAESRAVEAHLQTCGDCRKRWKDLQKLQGALIKSPELAPPERFYRQIMMKLQEDEEPPYFWQWPVATKALATAGALMLMVMVVREAKRSQPELMMTPTESANEKAVVAEAPASNAPLAAITQTAPTVQAKEEFAAVPTKAKAAAPKPVQREADVKNSVSGETRISVPAQPIANASSMGQLQNAEPLRQVASRAYLGSPPVLAQAVRASASQSDSLDQAGALKKSAAPEAALSDRFSVATNAPAVQPNSASGALMNPPVEWQGTSSGISAFRAIAINSQVDWEALWKDHAPNTTAPPVDFSRYTVVALFSGAKPSTGYSVTITDVQTLPNAVTVSYKEQNPPPDAATSQVVTQPYYARLIPKTALPIQFTKVP